MLNLETQEALKEVKKRLQWTDFMNEVFVKLHEQAVTKEDMSTVLKNMELTFGMEDLINQLKKSQSSFDSIIISDSNSFFIETILENYNFENIFSKVYTNPGNFEDTGKLLIKPCHSHTHTTCPVNMCKHELLCNYKETKLSEGILYNVVYYVGDGGNDFCPVSSLSASDYGFPRSDYALERILKKTTQNIDCTIHVWKSASEIERLIFDVKLE